MGRKPIPNPGFLDSCHYLGYVRGQRRWRTTEGDLLLTWDSLHGEIEAYDRLGRHVGVRDVRSGERVKEAVRGRRIDV